MTPDDALAQLQAAGDPEKAAKDAAYHKTERPTWGVPGDVIAALTTGWRQDLPMAERLTIAQALWQADVHDTRIAAPKLLTQARIKDREAEAFDLLLSWAPDFDGWAIADTVCGALAKRLIAHPERLDIIEGWTAAEDLWTKRAALVATLPWCKQRHPSDAERQQRTRILGWVEGYVPDDRWFIQKAIAWWLRDLSKREPERVRAFLQEHGSRMKPFAMKEAGRHMPEIT